MVYVPALRRRVYCPVDPVRVVDELGVTVTVAPEIFHVGYALSVTIPDSVRLSAVAELMSSSSRPCLEIGSSATARSLKAVMGVGVAGDDGNDPGLLPPQDSVTTAKTVAAQAN